MNIVIDLWSAHFNLQWDNDPSLEAFKQHVRRIIGIPKVWNITDRSSKSTKGYQKLS